MKNIIWIFMGIALNMCVAFSHIVIFTTVILPDNECGRNFYFLMFSAVSFQSYSFHIRGLLPPWLHFFLGIFWGNCEWDFFSLLAFLACSLLVYWKVTDFCMCFLYAELSNVFIRTKSPLVQSSVSFKYMILSSAKE